MTYHQSTDRAAQQRALGLVAAGHQADAPAQPLTPEQQTYRQTLHQADQAGHPLTAGQRLQLGYLDNAHTKSQTD